LQAVARENPIPRTGRSEVEDELRSSMPGDDISTHPLNYLQGNPFSGKNVLSVKRALENGEIKTPQERRQAMEWLQTYAQFTGDVIFPVTK